MIVIDESTNNSEHRSQCVFNQLKASPQHCTQGGHTNVDRT